MHNLNSRSIFTNLQILQFHVKCLLQYHLGKNVLQFSYPVEIWYIFFNLLESSTPTFQENFNIYAFTIVHNDWMISKLPVF